MSTCNCSGHVGREGLRGRATKKTRWSRRSLCTALSADAGGGGSPTGTGLGTQCTVCRAEPGTGRPGLPRNEGDVAAAPGGPAAGGHQGGSSWLLDVGIICPGSQRLVDRGADVIPRLVAREYAKKKVARYGDQDNNFVAFIVETGGRASQPGGAPVSRRILPAGTRGGRHRGGAEAQSDGAARGQPRAVAAAGVCWRGLSSKSMRLTLHVCIVCHVCMNVCHVGMYVLAS